MFSSQNSQASSDVNYIDDVFSTWLYKGTGTGVTNTITNNINLSGKGGLTWIKCRNVAYNNILFDTARGDFEISSNTTAAQANNGRVFVPLSTGFSLKGGENVTNNTGNSYASWTFREQPKFFDVVTYTGDGTNKVISHNLGSTPGFIIIKRLDSTSDWFTAHRSLDLGQSVGLNSTSAVDATYNALLGSFSSSTTSTTITISGARSGVSGATYVAYLFAHNAGGFGLTGTDNVISCGSYTGNGATNGGPSITLGYEPQYVLIKRASGGTGSWIIQDSIRGLTSNNASAIDYNSTLLANDAGAEAPSQYIKPTSTGFDVVSPSAPVNASASTYLYIAIRRPMKPPTTGTSVFSVDTTTADNAITSTLQQSDMGLFRDRTTVTNWFVADRLRGFTNAYYTPTLYTNLTSAEATPTTGDTLTAFGPTTTGITNGVLYAGGAGVAGNYPLLYSFKRAPGFFDEVCYTGNNIAGTTQAHNLGSIPELMIVKSRGTVINWAVYSAAIGASNGLILNLTTASSVSNGFWNSTAPTNSVFTIGGGSNTNANAVNYVAYLFATVAGVSKVGSYTGTGALQTVACGFTTGARFVLVKRVDSTGDWYVWDSARGISSGTDPYLTLNTTAAEVTSTNWVDTTSTGFQVTAASGNNVNINGASYIFLSVA